MKRALSLLGLLAPLLFAAPSHAIGVLVPTESSLDPLAIESHRVEVEIKDQTAQTKIVQVFRNSTSRQLEAIYTFPLPKGASIADFALWMNGKRVTGEVLEKEKAREIYEGIVRRAKDPGLIEYIGNDIFQARVFPIPANGTQKIELSFTSVLPREGGVSKYLYPLKTGGKSAQTLTDFTLTVKLASKTPIKNIYSPTHSISVQKKGDYNATVGFEFNRAVLEKDFSLYYSLSNKDVGIDLLTFKRPGEDGYFMLLASPKQEYADQEIIGKHVTFVVDTSGSMSGEKMERARKALVYCLQNLRDDDTFSIVRFSSDVELFEEAPKPATKEWKEKAVSFAQKMEAAGGTAIYDAMDAALKVNVKGNGPRLVVFLTDGSPTVGETDPKKIAEMVTKSNAGKQRVFVFGVGETVNAVLLDKMAADNGGFAEYMKPDAEVETALVAFYDKIAYPVLSNAVLEIPGVKTTDKFPRNVGDLYRGQQVVLFGRYKEKGASVISLKGLIDGKEKKFDFEGEFPNEASTNDFIPRLWATRKVGYLLEEIRINGESAELREEVVRLGKEFGIVTPYTSYLVVEDESSQVAPQPCCTTSSGGSARAPEPAPAVPKWGSTAPRTATDESEELIITTEKSGGFFDGDSRRERRKAKKLAPKTPSAAPREENKPADAPSAAPAPVVDYSASTGASGIAASKDSRTKKEAQQDEDNGYSKYLDGKNFLWNGSSWVDSGYDGKTQTLAIAPMSDAYFALLALRPDLAKSLALGEVVILVAKGKAVVITASGKSKIDAKELTAFCK